MNAATGFFDGPLAEQIGWTLLHSVWQGTFVAALLAALLRTLRNRSAEIQYSVSSAALCLMVGCVLLTGWLMAQTSDSVRSVAEARVKTTEATEIAAPKNDAGSVVRNERSEISSNAATNSTAPATSFVPLPTSEAPANSLPDWLTIAESFRSFAEPRLPWLVGCWLIGVVVCSIRLLAAWRQVQTLRRTGVAPASQQFTDSAARLSERLSVGRTVMLLESTLAEVPMVIGWLKPVILLPVVATSGLTVRQIDAIIAHELAHIRRWDYPVNLLQSVVETILFYHPAVWWISARMRQERENCCDDIASEVCEDRVTYARALLEMEELRQPGSLVPAASGGDLIARVRRLISPTRDADGSARGLAGVVALLAVGATLTGILLAANGDSSAGEDSLAGARAILRDGDLIVEFAALSRDAVGKDSWWQPNGEPYPSDFLQGENVKTKDDGPTALSMGFDIQCSRADIAAVAKFPSIGGGFWSTRSIRNAQDETSLQKVYVAGTFPRLADDIDVDLLFSLEEWRPWKTVQLADDDIAPWGTGEFTQRANEVDTTAYQLGDLLHAFEHPGGKIVEVVLVWPKDVQSRAQLQVEAFDADGNAVESVGMAGYQQAHGTYFTGTRNDIAAFRYRIRYYTDKVTYANASLVPGKPARVTHRVVRLETPPPEFTPSRIADEIEAAMQRFENVEYTAETTATVNTNSYRTDEEPVLVKGETSYLYRSDGPRWFVDEKGFTYSQGEAEVGPQEYLAGFDGELHYSVDGFGTVKLGEEHLSNVRLSPRAVFWRAARSEGWLLSALRHEEAKIEFDKAIEGRRVVRVVSEWQLGEDQWRFETEVLPDHSWLPLNTKVFYGSEMLGTETITKLAQTDDSVWYPSQIKWSVEPGPYDTTHDKTITVTEFSLPSDVMNPDFVYEIPLGKAVVDYRNGITYNNDPWYHELAPWLRETVDHPPRDLSAIRDLRSYSDNSIDGKPAPPIHAAEWIVGDDPGPWANGDGRPTVLFFFGGRAISPTPQQLVVLKTLAERFKTPRLDDAGLNVAAVAAAYDNNPAMTRQAMKELQVNFPVAIDSPNAAGQIYGRTFAAYGLNSYHGVFVIDAQGMAHVVEPDRVPADSDLSALEHVLKNLEHGAIPFDTSLGQRRSLSRDEHDQIESHWQKLASEKSGKGKIAGRIEATADGRDVFGQDKLKESKRSGVAATIEIVPVLMLLHGSPSSRHVLRDKNRLTVVTCQPDGTFEIPDLCRGEYKATVMAPGLARTERSVMLGHDAATANVDVLLNQGDVILGTVVDTDGKPITGATVEATKRHFNSDYLSQYTTAHLPQKLTTDKDGNFAWEWLFFGAYTFKVNAPGFEPKDVPLVPAGKQSVKIVLQPLPLR